MDLSIIWNDDENCPLLLPMNFSSLFHDVARIAVCDYYEMNDALNQEITDDGDRRWADNILHNDWLLQQLSLLLW